MTDLSITYDNTRAAKRRDFDIDEITDVLMAEPINLPIDNIIHTPESIIVKLPRNEYMKRRIGTLILRKYNAITICKDDMLIFQKDEIYCR